MGGERRGFGSAEPGNEKGGVHDEYEQSDLDAKLSLIFPRKKKKRKKRNRHKKKRQVTDK